MSKASHYTILLLKACTTSWDAEDRLCGVADLPVAEGSLDLLSDVIRSSTELRSLRDEMDIVLCGQSDVSIKCGEILAGSGGVKVKGIENLGELNLGLWEGVLRDDLVERFPSVYAQWVEQPGMVAPPDGETLDGVQERIVGQLFKSLLKLKSEHPVVGLVLRPYAWGVMKCWVDQKPLSEVWGYLEMDCGLESFSLDRDVVEANRSRKTKIA